MIFDSGVILSYFKLKVIFSPFFSVLVVSNHLC